MRKSINKILNNFGYELCRILQVNKGSDYEFLKKIPRYAEQNIRLLGHDFKIADSLSFYYSYREIFNDNIYKFEPIQEIPTIIDCGANYGTSALYFKREYPNCQLTCVEADPNIFNLLKWNLDQHKHNGIELINRAVSNSELPVLFYQEGADGGRMIPIDGFEQSVEIPSIHLDDLIQGPVDFLKMDIEGCETEVILNSEKLNQVSQIFIEYHSFKNSEQTLSSLLESLSTRGFRYYIHSQFCSQRPFTEESIQLGMDLQLNIFAKKEN